MSVNRRLTRKRRPREREIPEYASMVRRVIRAHGRRCGGADPEDLAGLVDMRDTVEEAIADAIAGLRLNDFSWDQIGRALGMTKQAVHKRYGIPHSGGGDV